MKNVMPTLHNGLSYLRKHVTQEVKLPTLQTSCADNKLSHYHPGGN